MEEILFLYILLSYLQNCNIHVQLYMAGRMFSFLFIMLRLSYISVTYLTIQQHSVRKQRIRIRIKHR